MVLRLIKYLLALCCLKGFYASICLKPDASSEPNSQLSFLDCELAPPLGPAPWIAQQPISNAGSSNWPGKPRIADRWVELDAAVALSQLASSATGCPPLANPLSLQASGHQMAGQPPTCTWNIPVERRPCVAMIFRGCQAKIKTKTVMLNRRSIRLHGSSCDCGVSRLQRQSGESEQTKTQCFRLGLVHQFDHSRRRTPSLVGSVGVY